MTDPLLRNRVGPLVRIAGSASPPAIGRLDAILLSHMHADHTDPRSLRAIPRRVPVLAPRGAARFLRRIGRDDVRELSCGSALSVGRVQILATPATHDGGRRPFGPRADAIGYLARGAISVYFAGDTDLFPQMEELRGHVDVALLPIWGWGPSLGPGHLDPARAAQAVARIAPLVAIPIHWGTLALGWPARRPVDPGAPARRFVELARRCAPRTEARVLMPGESTVLR